MNDSDFKRENASGSSSNFITKLPALKETPILTLKIRSDVLQPKVDNKTHFETFLSH